jgi:secreted PhoX family phosphatase
MIHRVDRRGFLRYAGAVAASAVAGTSLWQRALSALAVSGPGPYGPLLDPDENGIRLPAGFSSRVIARAGELVAGTGHRWHLLPDGGATFRTRGGWIYVSNSEFLQQGGVSAIRFDHRGAIADAYPILTGSQFNCAGGATPWGTWLSCEEAPDGNVWECDPEGLTPAVKRLALGTFSHEAAAVDVDHRCLYMTEDMGDGRFYRFVPDPWPSLDSGVLQVAAVDAGGAVTWHDVPEPNPDFFNNPTRLQVPQSTAFDGGEGLAYSRGHAYFTTKGDNRVWDYDPAAQTLGLLYDADQDPGRQLTGVDNAAISLDGDVIVAEDGGNMELVMLTPQGVAAPLLRVLNQASSELAGPAFDPSGHRLYVSSQRGGRGGITYEIAGPFRRVFSC